MIGWAYHNKHLNSSKGGKYLVIKEWGIRMKVDPVLKNMSYDFSSPQTVVLNSGLQGILPKECAAKFSKAWSIIRYSPDDPSPVETDGGGIKIKDSKYIPNTAMRKVGSYYYQRTYPQLGCPQDKGNDIVKEIDFAYRDAFESLELL